MFYRRSRCVETPALFLWVRPAALRGAVLPGDLPAFAGSPPCKHLPGRTQQFCGADLQTFSFFCDLSVKSNGFEQSGLFM